MSKDLKNRASKNFDKYLKEFQEDGIIRMLPLERLTSQEWDMLNSKLSNENVVMIPAEKNGKKYMRFSNIIELIPVQEESEDVSTVSDDIVVVAVPDEVIEVIPAPDIDLSRYNPKTVSFNGVPAIVCVLENMGRAMAEQLAKRIENSNEYFASALNVSGTSNSDYIVIAMKRSDAALLGCRYNGMLTLPKDNSASMARLSDIIGRPLTHINGVPVFIESMSDFGVTSGRAIVLVSVGGKKLPFYISSGSAGKTDVPTGKWEFFGGFSSTGWFRKGASVEEIVAHYYSPELKQIADALDANIGDTRDTLDVLKTIGRRYLGGQGDVAILEHATRIDASKVNKDVFFPENEGNFRLDIIMIKSFLKNLQPVKDMVSELRKVKKELKSNIISKISSLFKEENNQQ